jgi:hypothetical protein
MDEMTQLQVVEGPVAYIGELCKRAVELNYTSEMNARIESGIQECFQLSQMKTLQLPFQYWITCRSS